MQEFTKLLIDIVSNMDDIKFSEIKKFASTLEAQKHKTISFLKAEIKTIEEYSSKFLQLAINHKITKTEKTIIKTVGNISISCPLLNNPLDAIKHPHVPCCVVDVQHWFFISFPELNQVLPVHDNFTMFQSHQTNNFLKLDENIFKQDLYSNLKYSTYAVFPYTAETYKKLQLLPKKEWDDVLHQLTISTINSKSALPLKSTTFLLENIKKTSHKDMYLHWSVLVQQYFILYLYKQVAGPAHLSI